MKKTINKLSSLFEDMVEQPKNYLRADKGNEFEQRIKTSFIPFLGQLFKDHFDIWEFQKLKNEVGNKNATSDIKNWFSRFNKHFIFQPFGSQNYPDFIIFLSNFIIPIEIKFSRGTVKRPVWNSNLPKYNGFYIFGAYGNLKVTIFKGEFVLSIEERKELTNFWDQAKESEQSFKDSLKKKILKLKDFRLEYGFTPYIRRAYDQNKQINQKAKIDFFNNSQRKKLEKQTIDKIKFFESFD